MFRFLNYRNSVAKQEDTPDDAVLPIGRYPNESNFEEAETSGSLIGAFLDASRNIDSDDTMSEADAETHFGEKIVEGGYTPEDDYMIAMKNRAVGMVQMASPNTNCNPGSNAHRLCCAVAAWLFNHRSQISMEAAEDLLGLPSRYILDVMPEHRIEKRRRMEEGTTVRDVKPSDRTKLLGGGNE
jgi:hypothetical protein